MPKHQPELRTALFIGDDVMAAGYMKAKLRMAIRIPQDVSMVGFDDLSISSMIDPPSTTVRANNRQIGRAAVDLQIRES